MGQLEDIPFGICTYVVQINLLHVAGDHSGGVKFYKEVHEYFAWIRNSVQP